MLRQYDWASASAVAAWRPSEAAKGAFASARQAAIGVNSARLVPAGPAPLASCQSGFSGVLPATQARPPSSSRRLHARSLGQFLVVLPLHLDSHTVWPRAG